MDKITLKGKQLSTQHIYRYACRGSFPTMYMTKKGKDLKEDYQWQAKSQWKGKPLTDDVRLEIELYFGDKRKRDWDNFHKLTMDSLEGIVFENDNQIKEATVKLKYDKDNPRTEIVIHS